MAHYAFLDENNIVVNVIKGIDETELIDGLAPEVWYENFEGKKCIRTSINHNIRKRYAHLGDTYDSINDVFIRPKPYPSWVLDEDFAWKPPVTPPSDYTKIWMWNEDLLTWEEDTDAPTPELTIDDLL